MPPKLLLLLIAIAGESGSAYEPYYLPLQSLYVYLKVRGIFDCRGRHELTAAGRGGTPVIERFANSAGEAQHSLPLLSTLWSKSEILSSDFGRGGFVYIVTNWYCRGRPF